MVRRLQSGDPAAFQELWGAWRDRCWSTIRPMVASREEAVMLLRDVYLGLPGAVLGWPADVELCCLIGCQVYSAVRRRLELPSIVGIQAHVPPTLAVPNRDGVARKISTMPPSVRLTYLVDLFFSCPAAMTAALVNEDEGQLRQARSQGAWVVVAATPAES